MVRVDGVCRGYAVNGGSVMKNIFLVDRDPGLYMKGWVSLHVPDSSSRPRVEVGD